MKKTENLEKELLMELQNLQTQINTTIISFGELSVAKLEVEDELRKIQDQTETLTNHYKEIYSNWNNKMSELSKKYNDGEINLTEGTVTYEVI
jgi:predicted nuclease with TOPRIM domain